MNHGPKFFKVLNECESSIDFESLGKTCHFDQERMRRHNRIISILGRNPKLLYSFVVDKHHPNGNEIHTIFSNGIIIITNQRTGLLITELIARPGQIKRYWKNKKIPDDIKQVILLAKHHQELGYNNW